MSDFLPICAQDMRARGWEQCDFVCVTGDAYVDHPSFGTAIITRVLEDEGFRVGVLAQPDWRSPHGITALSRPRLAFLVNSGNVDSMVAHYTAAKRPRSDDPYSPGNRAGARPDRAVEVYCRIIRQAYGDVPILIGGIEASLRRFAHYDYWDDAVRPSILYSSGADLLVYGMGELPLAEIARRLHAGEPVSAIRDVRGTCYLTDGPPPDNHAACASFAKASADKKSYAKAHQIQTLEQDCVTGRPVVQKHADKLLVQNPPQRPLTTQELDHVFDLPYMRAYHPVYEEKGGVKAIEEVEFSIAHNRGCFGSCNFCAIAFHQGRRVTSRSLPSVLREAEGFQESPRYKGYIHDVGGPTAQFRRASCDKQIKHGMCRDRKCLAPEPCRALKADHSEYLAILRALRALPGVRKVFIRSGVRFDYALLDPDHTFIRELVKHHVSGQLRVAPEHCSNHVLGLMGKPPVRVYEQFEKEFYRTTKALGKEQYLVPYLMSSHPGSRIEDAVALALFLKKHRLRPEQVQDFYPTPGTASTCMYYTGLDPATGAPVYVPKSPQEKALQRALLQYYKPENRRAVIDALVACKREDLIGTSNACLVAPDAQYLRQKRQKAAQMAKPGTPGKTKGPGKVGKASKPDRLGTQGDTRHPPRRDGAVEKREVRRRGRKA